MCGTCLSPDSHTPSYLRDNWHLPAQSSYPMAVRGRLVCGGGGQEVLHQAPCSWNSCVLAGSEGSRGALSRSHLAGAQLPVCTVGLSGLYHAPCRHLLPTKRPSWSSPQALRYPAAPPAALPAAMLSYLKAPGHSHSPVLWKAQLWPPKDVPALTPELVCYLMW